MFQNKNDQQQINSQFSSIVCLSESGTNFLLLYPVSSDPRQCYKYKHVKTLKSGNGHFYACYGCIISKRNDKELFNFTIQTVRVSVDYTRFESDPEAMRHCCLEKIGTFDFEKEMKKQAYREMIHSVRENGGIKPQQAESVPTLCFENQQKEQVVDFPNFLLDESTNQTKKISPKNKLLLNDANDKEKKSKKKNAIDSFLDMFMSTPISNGSLLQDIPPLNPTSSLTSKWTDDCYFVYNMGNGREQQNGWKFTSGGKYTNKHNEVITTFVCSGCRSIYDKEKRSGVIASNHSYAALPKALFNKTTNTWKPNPYDIPLNMHFCQPIFANEQNVDKDEIAAKRPRQQIEIKNEYTPDFVTQNQTSNQAIEDYLAAHLLPSSSTDLNFIDDIEESISSGDNFALFDDPPQPTFEPQQLQQLQTIKTEALSPEEEKIEDAIMEMIATDALPICTVENKGFKHLMRVLAPGFDIKSKEHFERVVMPRIFRKRSQH